MDNVNTIKRVVTAVLSIIGSVAVNFLGGWDTALQTLLIFMTVDYALGLAVAGIYKKSPKTESGGLNSKTGWIGIVKKLLTLIMVLVGTQLDLLLGVEYIRIGLIFALLFDEGISIVENYALTGKKVPNILIDSLDLLQKDKGE